MDFKAVDDAVLEFWGRRLNYHFLLQFSGQLTAVVYEAYYLELTAVGEMLHLEVTALDPYPETLTSRGLSPDKLPGVLKDIDATLRAALPPTFLACVEEAIRRDLARDEALKKPCITWQERDVINEARRPEPYTHDAGTPLTTDDLRRIITDRYGNRASLQPTDPAALDTAKARIDGRFGIRMGFEYFHNAPIPALGGGIVLSGWGVAPFEYPLGGWQNDETTAHVILDHIDQWYRIRTGEQTTMPHDI